MRKSSLPQQEVERLAELKRYQLLDTPPEPVFDRLTAIAAELFDVPIALISLVDFDRVWFKSRHGLNVEESKLFPGFCSDAVAQDEVLVVPDSLQHPRAKHHPLVTGPEGIRFYAGAPLRTARGHNIGVFCLLDTRPRELTPARQELLRNLAAITVDQMDLRIATRERERAAADEAVLKERQLFTAGPITVFKWKAESNWPVEYVSPNVEQFGYRPEEFTGGEIPYAKIIHPDDLDRVGAEVKLYSESGVDCFNQEYRIFRKDGQVRWVYDFTVIVRDEDRSIRYYHGYIFDSTAWKQVEEALRDSWRKYEAVVEAFDGLVYICSQDYKVEFMNQRLIERTGRNAVGELCYKVLHDREDICPWCVIDSVFEGKTVRWEILSPKDNRWYYVVNTPITHPDGRTSKMAMIQDITERKSAEELLKRRDALLEAVNFASDQFLKKTQWEQVVQEVLDRLGQTTGTSRVYIVQARKTEDGTILTSRRFGWSAQGIPSLLYRPDLQDFPMKAKGFGRWLDFLMANQIVEGHVREFPDSEKALLGALGVKSLVAVPIFVEREWWGFLGFDSCGAERQWSPAEIEVIKMAAGLLGSAILHQRIEDALQTERNTAQQYLDIAGVMMVAIGADEKVTLINRKGCEILRGPTSEIVGKNWFDTFVPAGIRETVRAVFRKLIAGDAPVAEYYENPVRTLRNEERIIAWHNTLIRDDADAVIGTLSSGEDVTDRKQAEMQLLELSLAVNQTADSVVITDREGNIEYVNPGFEKLTGYAAREVIGKTPQVLKSGKHDDAFYRKLWNTITRGDVFRAEFVNRRKNGELYYQGETITPIRDAAGQITHFVSTGRDVTERVTREEMLRESERRMADIISFLPDATFAIDRDGKIIAWNRAVEALTGAKASDMLGKGDYEHAIPFYGKRRKILVDLVVHPDEEAERQYAYVERIKDTLVAEVFLPNLRTHGADVWAIATALYDSQGHIVGAIESVRDITERKKAEAAIRKLAAFPQLNPNPVVEFTADGSLTYFNKAAKDLAVSLGHENPLDLLPPNAGELARQCLAEEQNKRGVDVTVGKHTITWALFPVLETQTVHGYGYDMSDRLGLENQLRHLQKMEAVGRLAGGIAHDFNNILTAILGYSSMLLLDENLDPQTLQQVKEISKTAERASHLTRQLLTFSRKQVLQPKTLNLNHVLKGMSQLLTRTIGEDVALQFDYAADLPDVRADESMMEQVILNLVINARDAMPTGGTLTISTAAAKVPPSHVTENPEARAGSFVRVRVRDTGVGMDEEVQAQIFEPFFTTKDAAKGTGLGLAIVYGIIKQHGGWIEVESEEKRGSVFTFYLPARAEKEPASVRILPAEKPPLLSGTETILVVEDEPTVRALACSILTQYGYKVLEAASGPEGLRIWKAHAAKINLLLADVVMPGGLTGPELAEKLREQRKNLKVLLTSGYRFKASDQKITLDKITQFLPKPFSPEELARAVRDCLDNA